MSKPHNYGQMSLTERRQWDANEREKDDAEYAAREASEKAERAERDLRRSRESYRSEVNDFNERIDRLVSDNDDLVDELNAVNNIRENQRVAIEFLRDFIAREGHMVEFLTWHRLTNMRADGTEPEDNEAFQLVRKLFDRDIPETTPKAEKGGE